MGHRNRMSDTERINRINLNVLEIYPADLFPLQTFERIRQQNIAIHANSLFQYFIGAFEESHLRELSGRVKRGSIDYQLFKRRFHRLGIAYIEFACGVGVTSPDVSGAALSRIAAQPEAG